MDTVKTENAVTSPQDETTNPDLLKEEATQTDETVQGAESETDQAQQTDDEQEVEIVLDGDDGSQPKHKTNLGVHRRIKNLNAKVDAAKEARTQAEEELALERERSRMWRLAAEGKSQQPELPEPPDPFDFDGAKDPAYRQAYADYTQKIVDNTLAKQKASQPKPEPQVDTALLQKQEAHYERAAKLGVKDYEQAEDVALDVLGKDIVNHIIASSRKSSELLYYLGKNSGKAEEIKELLSSPKTTVKGVLEIGRLEARLKPQPKAKTNPLPDPDEELEGKTGGSTNPLQKKLDAARSKMGDGSRMDEILKIKKEAKAQGVTLS